MSQNLSRGRRHACKSFLFGDRYRYSPVSPLYVFGRKQDYAL
ncbi:LssY C-terminal domain-containing protein, partial [Thiolapillus sp.]